MKRLRQIGLVGLVLGISAIIGVVALAATGTVQITVNKQPVGFLFNGVNDTPSGGIFDNQGTKVPDGLIYDGTTYVPIRLVSQLFRQPVSWNGATHSVVIGATATALTDLTPLCSGSAYSSNVSCNADHEVTMFRLSYPHAVQIVTNSGPAQADYNLGGLYNTFTFTVGLDDNNNQGTTAVTIYGDGKQLWSHQFQSGDPPKKDQTVTVTGVTDLRIVVLPNYLSETSAIDLVNATLSK